MRCVCTERRFSHGKLEGYLCRLLYVDVEAVEMKPPPPSSIEMAYSYADHDQERCLQEYRILKDTEIFIF